MLNKAWIFCYNCLMFKQKPFPFSMIVLAVLMALHSVGSYFSWYWVYPWFEYVIHTLGGLWAASVLLWLASYLGQICSMKEYKTKSLLIALISALFIGVVWELLENFAQLSAVSSGVYGFDTATDLLSDAIGGVLAYLYFTTIKKKPIYKQYDLHPFHNRIGLIHKA